MRVYRTFEALNHFLELKRSEGKSIGFVPTMGALHDGHLSLISSSKRDCDVTICSIFVNPTQFNNPNDLLKYPRNEFKDLELLEKVNCNVAFLPTVEEVYPGNHVKVPVELAGIENVMEGKHRPGHFDGVMEVVWRFFEQIKPTKAYFGEKDFQQLAVIKKMVLAMKSDIGVVSCEILREESGLAMSSRNVRLSDIGKESATFLSEQLLWAKSQYGIKETKDIESTVINRINDHPLFKLEYFEISDTVNLLPVTDSNTRARAFVAAHIEGVRLIDNMALNY